MKSPFDRLLTWCIKPWVVIFVLATVVLSFLYVDRPLAAMIYVYPHELARLILTGLTLSGKSSIYLIALFLLALLFQYGFHKKQLAYNTWFLWCCVFFPNVMCLILKISFGRARPSLLFEQQTHGFYGFSKEPTYWSFPSGHTTTIMGLMLGLCVLFPRRSWVFLTIGLLVALSRILLLYHHFSDVFIAAYLAVIEVGLLLFLFRRRGLLASDV